MSGFLMSIASIKLQPLAAYPPSSGKPHEPPPEVLQSTVARLLNRYQRPSCFWRQHVTVCDLYSPSLSFLLLSRSNQNQRFCLHMGCVQSGSGTPGFPRCSPTVPVQYLNSLLLLQLWHVQPRNMVSRFPNSPGSLLLPSHVTKGFTPRQFSCLLYIALFKLKFHILLNTCCDHIWQRDSFPSSSCALNIFISLIRISFSIAVTIERRPKVYNGQSLSHNPMLVPFWNWSSWKSAHCVMCTLLQSCCLSFLDFSRLFTAVENLCTYPEIPTMYRARHAGACWRKSNRILARL